MRITNKRDFNAGLFFLVVAGIFGFLSQEYSMGTANRMGPGYFPTLLSAIMFLLGAITLVMSLLPADAQDPPGKTDWRGLGLVLISVAFFALLLPLLGYVLATFSLIMIAASASREFSWKTAIPLAIGLIVFGIAVFGYGLELQFQVFPPFLTK